MGSEYERWLAEQDMPDRDMLTGIGDVFSRLTMGVARCEDRTRRLNPRWAADKGCAAWRRTEMSRLRERL